MELGNWALISSPSLLQLLPLIIFIVFALLGKGNYLGMFLGIIVGFFLTGQDLVSLTNAYTAAISSSTTVIGLLIMFGTGLGVLMTEARITHTLVYWIVKRIGINTRAKGKIVLILSSILVCGLLGTLAGGNAIISPILIPILAALGITPTVVAGPIQGIWRNRPDCWPADWCHPDHHAGNRPLLWAADAVCRDPLFSLLADRGLDRMQPRPAAYRRH